MLMKLVAHFVQRLLVKTISNSYVVDIVFYKNVFFFLQVYIFDQRPGHTFRLPQRSLAAATAEALLQTDDRRVAGRDLGRTTAYDWWSGAQNPVETVLQ